MIDIDRYLGAVAREVANGERDGKPTRIVVVSRSYDTTVEDLWDALTNAERLPRWFLPVEGDLKLGGHYQLKGNAGGTITACDPPRSFAATWEFGGGVSWVEITLSPDGEGATLELRHIAHPEDHWTQFGPGAVGIGWELGLMGLGMHLETGEAVDPAAVAAWYPTEGGKRFITVSGEAWGEADIASGETPEQARAAAGRTIAAYTGG